MKINYKNYEREKVREDTNNMYIFTDNINRTSGCSAVGDWNWYGKEFDKTKCYPSSTTSQIRGLENAYPICTQKYCYYAGSFKGGQWSDEQFEEFKSYLDSDIKRIKDNLYKYDSIIMPEGGLFNRPISQITLERTPKIYKYLLKQLLCLDS